MFVMKTKRIVDNIIRRFVCYNEMSNVYGGCNFNRCKSELNNEKCIIKHCSKNLYQTTGSRKLNPQVYKHIKREYQAVFSLLHRSGLRTTHQLSNYLQVRSIHSTGSAPQQQQKPPQNGDDKKPNKDDEDDSKISSLLAKAFLWMLTAYMLIAIVSLLFPSSNQPEVIRYVSWNEFVHHMLAKGEVEEVIVRPDVDIVTIILHDGAIIKGKRIDHKTFHMNIVDMKRFEEKLREAERNLGLTVDNGVPIIYERSSDTAGKLLASLIVVGLLLSVLSRSKSIRPPISMDTFTQLGRAKFTLVDPLTGPGKGVHFSDVAGLKEAKQEVMEFVDYLKRPEHYKRLGAKVPKGALLLGPPGCGKTLLAKAVATEANVPFLSMNGSEFIEMIGGLGAARVRDLFKEGRKRSPCIIYIDEIDAIGRKRSAGIGQFDEASGEGEQTLNQLLVEMDGMASKEGVIMLASTNRDDVLDKALLRPGRFDRHILIDLPTLEERKQIFEQHLKCISLENSPENYSKRLAHLTPGFSGADIANVCNEAALHAARYKQTIVRGENLEYAVERVVGGTEKRSHVMSPAEKKVVAYHESGHAIVGWMLRYTDALLKVTIVPRTTLALGFAQYMPTDQKLYSREELFERMCMALGGRVAESLTFNSITTGAQNDLQKVTKMAYAQVRVYGMSKLVGLVSFPEEETREIGKRPYSKRMTALIDEEAYRLVTAAYVKTEQVLKENKEKLELLAETLLKKETLNYDDVEKLIGPPPFGKKRLVGPEEFEQSVNKEAGEEKSQQQQQI
ncbi:paraplegin isoform X1 [Zootermopsis nevadensis]|uniref:Paraplegin n=2 Tax=Zootermopsis nevadensis TaxID=136037 RepID=A0A067QZP8_ZOONE|nr:paraplegin isoform X1 [Zootermopsis nevadensis]KDR15916.1 Paraplegin [Zootermopsis nevadensis]